MGNLPPNYSQTYVYHVWIAMRNRCRDKSNPHYGGAGIKVCRRWADFETFVEDMGPRPKGAILARIDKAKGYRPENCFWASPQEANRGKSNGKVVQICGQSKSLIEWARLSGVNPCTLGQRVDRGVPEHLLLSKEKLTC